MYMLYYLNYAFLWNFIMGYLLISNNNILTTFNPNTTGNKDSVSRFVNLTRVLTPHTILFLVGNGIMLLAQLEGLCKGRLLSFISKVIPCLHNIKGKIIDMEAISDDYYNEIHIKFLINEYERSKLERKVYE